MVKRRNADSITLDDLPAEMIRATVSYAEFQAMLVGELLTKLGHVKPDNKNPVTPFSAATLLELGATLHLLVWREHGIIEYLDGVPGVDNAIEVSISRVCDELNGSSRTIDQMSDLPKTVFGIWLDQCSWTSRQQMGVDIVLRSDARKSFVEELAKLLWKNRDAIYNSEVTHDET
jgi:hypothetical protein